MIDKTKIYKWDAKLYHDQIYQVPNIEFKYSDAKENEHFEKFKDELYRWRSAVFKFKDGDKFKEHSVVRFGLCCFPQANHEQMFAISKMIEWIFVFDDYIEKNPDNKVNEQYLHHIFDHQNYIHKSDIIQNNNLNSRFKEDSKNDVNGDDTDDDYFGKLFWDIVDGFCADDQSLIDQFVSETKRGFLYSLNKRDQLCNSTTFEEYTDIRLEDSGAYFTITSYMANLKGKNTLTDDIYQSTQFQSFRRWYGIACQLVNDLFSFKKEMKDEDLVNYVKILVLQNNNIQISMNQVSELIQQAFDNMMKDIEALRLIYPNNITLNEYLNAGISICAGNLLFSKTTLRYK